MEYKKPYDQVEAGHKKAQDAIDHATEVRIGVAEELRKKHAKKAAQEAHLIADGDLKRCSVCGYPFPADVHPSMSVAFSDHLSKAHKPGQTNEDFNQAAARVVRESTEK